MSSWSVPRLAAETVIVPAPETDVAYVADEVADGAGGVVLFGSVAPPDLAAQLAALRAKAPVGARPLVMTDEEGGGVQRMANLVGNLPWAAYMGRNWTPGYITTQVAAMARKMAATGVTMDLAPVADVDGTNVAPGPADPDGWRSFSADPAVVAADAAAFSRGLEQAGVTPVVKHFPGLGGATGNTDSGAATTLPWATLQRSALVPFQRQIAEAVPAVMVSDAVVPGLSSLPASLSPEVIQTALVGGLGFRGLILTDSLSAPAISAAGYPVPAAAVQALRAGADMTMFTTMAGSAATDALFDSVVASVTAAVGQGSLSRGRLVAAARAVLTATGTSECAG
ncbi:MAG TPA: glycoside hydrolase family 3 N-terminal domain-containing protein [Acidimicrobiales bacterium]|nr:glycoside hydrolase family 3 N-terminal domain-containing protein [Acidimicrobiales bacterium]